MQISEARPGMPCFMHDPQGNRVYGTLERVFHDRVIFQAKPFREPDGNLTTVKPILVVAKLHGILSNLHVHSAMADSLNELARDMKAARAKKAGEVSRNIAAFNAQLEAAVGNHRIKQGWVNQEKAEAEAQAQARKEQAAATAPAEAWQ